MRQFTFLAIAAVALAGCSSILPPSELKPLAGDVSVSADTGPVPCQTHTLYLDNDGDNFGDAAKPLETCAATVAKHVDNKLDCNDAAKTVHPGAPETCNKIDDDCNLVVDDSMTKEWWVDADKDGYGNPKLKHIGSCTGVEDWLVGNDLDCNDIPGPGEAIHPGVPELCDSIDNDCNEQIDEGTLLTFYKDADGDGHGLLTQTEMACKAPANATSTSDDCNDGNKLIYLGAPELCDNLDNDCNGKTDEGKLNTFYKDTDGDGHGDLNQTEMACNVPAGATTTSDDCNDDPFKGGKAIFPGAVEVCNEIDDNCSGKTDEGVLLSFYYDNDGDGFAGAGQPVFKCSAPKGYFSDKADCDDTDPAIHPGAKEICDGKDNTCAGQLLEPDSLCDDGTPYKKFTCGGVKGCSDKDEELILSCSNSPLFPADKGWDCWVSYYFGDPLVDKQLKATYAKDSATLLMKDVCAWLKAGKILRTNSFAITNPDNAPIPDPVFFYVGAAFTKLINTFTNENQPVSPGNVTSSYGTLDNNYSADEIKGCK